MIPASSFLLDGGTAWCVHPSVTEFAWELDRPCDTCNGRKGSVTAYNVGTPDVWAFEQECSDCDGTGRHTFDTEVVGEMVEATHAAHAWKMDPPRRTLRVHVIDVLPIYAHGTHVDIRNVRKYVRIERGSAALQDGTGDGWVWERITLPPDAAPGMWLVRLAVHP